MTTTLECRWSEDAGLHQLVRQGLPALRHKLEEADRCLPRHVQRSLERFLACGDPTVGFAWLKCTPCDYHRLVTFSCKQRGLCPRCGGRLMADRAARWVDHLIPRVAVRQWVLTVPWKRRWELARHHHLVRGVARVLLREVRRFYRRKSRRAEGRTGSVTVVQRFGSALNLNVHLHALVLDGVFARDSRTGRLFFHRVRAPTTGEVEQLVVRVAERCERWLASQGFGDDDAGDTEDEALPLIQAASVQGRSASTGRRVRRVQLLGGRPFALPPRCASFEGYNLHAGVGLPAKDRRGLERLCRYVLRPPLARERCEQRPDGTVRLRLKRAWSDGTTHLTFSTGEFVEKMVALVPPPRVNLVLYHGVLAPRAKWRAEVLPKTKPSRARKPANKLARPEKRVSRARWRSWEELLFRVFGVQGWRCPRCGELMELRTVVVGVTAAQKVIDGLERSARGPPLGDVLRVKAGP